MSHKFQIYFSILLAKIVLYILESYSVDTFLLLLIICVCVYVWLVGWLVVCSGSFCRFDSL